MFFNNHQKLIFEISNQPSELDLDEVFAGCAGKVALGENGVDLWTPNAHVEKAHRHIVCDVRFDPISEAMYKRFVQAARGRFLPAYMAVFQGTDPDKIQMGLELFDYILVPDKRIKNRPVDFRNRVLSYRHE